MDAAAGETQAAAQVAEATPMPVEVMEEAVQDIEDAIERVLREAAVDGGIKTGLNQVIKSIEVEAAHVIFLAKNVEEANIGKAVRMLAAEKGTPVIEVPDSKELGRWAGLCKTDREGQARKIVGASCVAVVAYGGASPAFEYLDKHIKSLAA